MTSSNLLALRYSFSIRHPSLVSAVSFESDTHSSFGSSSSDTSATSSSTIWGPGALTGKALLSFGKATLRGAAAVVIQMRLQSLKSIFPHKLGDNYDERTIQKAYRDMLELTRRGCYSPRVRKQALRMALLQIRERRTQDLLRFLAEWPPIEISLFLREVMLCLPSGLTGLRQYQQDMHLQLAQDLTDASPELEPMRFFVDVITKLDGGIEAFIDAEGLDILLCVYSTPLQPRSIFDKDPLPLDIWRDVFRTLRGHAEAAQSRLLNVLREILRSRGNHHFLYRLVVMGSNDVDKSALTIQFLQSPPANKQDSSTKKCVVDDSIAVIEVLDTSGQEGYRALVEQYMHYGGGFLFVYSITSRSSFEHAVNSYRRMLLIKNVEHIDYFPSILVANHCDREDDRQVSMEEGQDLAKHLGCRFIETSVEQCVNVNEAFEILIREIRDYHITRP